MMAMLPVPQLMQCVSRSPNGLWGVNRFNRGYKGPTVQVRRSSDSATLDCYSQADIAAHCSGTNGFIVTTYDQTGQSRDLTQSTGSKQAKVYDSSTGMIKAGAVAGLKFTAASSQNFVRSDNSGFSTGNVAFTIAYSTSAWAFPAGSQIMLNVGPDTGGASADTFYSGRNASTTVYTACRLYNRSFTNNFDPVTTRNYIVDTKAASANMDTVIKRQVQVALTENSHTSGNLSLVSAGGMTNFGCAINVQQYCEATAHLAALWDLNLTGAELTNLEGFLEGIRLS